MANTDAPTIPIADQAEGHLIELSQRFMSALDALRASDIDSAAEQLRSILAVEPRLAEPRIELARILMDTGQLDEAESQAREGIRILEAGGHWIEAVPMAELLSLGWSLLGEALRQKADKDEVVFGDPAVYKRLTQEASSAFHRANQLDPDNDYARAWDQGLKQP